MNLPKFPHSAMFVGVTACSKTEFLLQLLQTKYKNHFEFIIILCPTILHDAAHTMMISDIATSAWLIDFCHKAI